LIGNSEAIGMLSIVQIGFEVELDNGILLRTKNLGGHTPYADFETEVSGGDYAGGDIKVAADARKISGDKIEIRAWSKFHANGVKGTLSVPLNYKNDIFYQYQGASGTSGRGKTVGYSETGGDGKDGRSLRIVAEKINVNGNIVCHLKIADASTGESLSEAKVNQSSKITINVSGGNGGSGVEGRSSYSDNGANGGNGGNAGDVYLSGSAASILQITVLNEGGKGGRGGEGKTTANTSGVNGSNGTKGNFYK
jgi:hypothetical protein